MEKKENNYMTSGPDKFEVGAAIVVFVLFVLPTIIGVCVMIWQFTKSMVTGKPMPEDPREFYGLKKKDDNRPTSEKIDKIVDRFWEAQETDAELHFRESPKRPQMLDPSDPEFFASYNRRGKEAK